MGLITSLGIVTPAQMLLHLFTNNAPAMPMPRPRKNRTPFQRTNQSDPVKYRIRRTMHAGTVSTLRKQEKYLRITEGKLRREKFRHG